MNTAAALSAEFLLHIHKEIDINAPVGIAFEALLEQLGPSSEMPDAKPMPMKIEPWPGGRWYRDLGNNSGHLWGHVQVIKPPKLLELCGPLAMSFAAINHVQYRLTEQGAGTRLSFTHRAIVGIAYEVEPLNGPANVVVQSELVANEALPSHGADARGPTRRSRRLVDQRTACGGRRPEPCPARPSSSGRSARPARAGAGARLR